ncbi:MAG: hypothetical protein HUU56_16185 [Bdellovibrionaceae bacterium]|nr:hypothetical protein [Pseudobdellovibrionaceae bacterium]
MYDTPKKNLFYLNLILVLLLAGFFLKAEEEEYERLQDFKRFKKDNKIIDEEREKGLAVYLEELDKEAFESRKALQEYKKQKKTERNSEDSKYYEEYLKEKKDQEQVYQEDLDEYLKDKKKYSSGKYKRPFSEEFELGILSDRPRYDYKKRALYGAKPKFKSSEGKGSSSGGASGTNSFPGSNNSRPDNNFTPPAPVDPFFDDIPPPPPPMPMDDGGGFNNDGFIPPPPPPPMFDGEF